ncbi:MAG: CPBP family intramembrane glutamic endopeptidase [Candidatus Saccharimonadales bacterium]
MCYKIANLNLSEIGLSSNNIKSGLKYGLLALSIITVSFTAAFLLHSQLFKDPRYNNSFYDTFYTVSILLPLKTVLFEELVFRGVGLTLLLKINASKLLAVSVSSIAFGIWHISSSVGVNGYYITDNFSVTKSLFIIASVLATAIAGFVLCGLRLRSKSLLAPIITHWSVNAIALLLAATSWHK